MHDRLRYEASLLSPTVVCAEVLALSIVEWTFAPGVRIAVALHRSGGTVRDNGRGVALIPDRGDTMSHAERAHTSIYPCEPTDRDVAQILREFVWGERGSFGPALPARACPSYEFVSERAGEKWTQRYRYGTPTGPPMLAGTTHVHGTTITFETAGPIDHAAFATLVEMLTLRMPRLPIALSVS